MEQPEEQTDYKRYLEVAHQLDLLTQEKKVIGERLLKRMETEGATRITGELGIVSLVEKVSYKYSEPLQAKMAAVKEEQKQEQDGGIAEKSVTAFLRTSLR